MEPARPPRMVHHRGRRWRYGHVLALRPTSSRHVLVAWP